MLDKKRFHIVANGSLHITNVQLGDQGKYFCMTSANKKQKYGTRYLFVRGKTFLKVTFRPFFLFKNNCDQ